MIEIRTPKGEVKEVQITVADFIKAGLLSPAGLLLPGHPLFDSCLFESLPPGWRAEGLKKFENTATFIIRPGKALMEPVSETELSDYLNSGEWEEREQETAAITD